MSQTERVPSERELQQEGDHFTGGPGVVATKSQARGGLGGAGLGAIAGAIVGAVLGAIMFGGASGIIITAVCGAVAFGVAGGVIGGAQNAKSNVAPDSPADN